MSRPTTAPEWASDTNFPAGTDAWSATATKLEPTSGEKGTGAIPQTGFGAQKLNWLLANKADWINHLESVITGAGMLLRDDFTGTAIDTGKWETTAAGAATIAIFDDSAAGGYGSIRLTAGATAVDIAKLRTANLGITTGDFIFRVRVKGSDVQSSTFEYGFMHDSAAAKQIYVKEVAGPNIDLYVGAASAYGSGDGLDSAVYKDIIVLRISGTLYYYASDGTLLYSAANATDLSGSRFQVKMTGNGGSAGTSEIEVDMAMAWIAR